MIDWTGGYSATWTAVEVNRDTWADGEEISGVRTVSIDRSSGGDPPTMESGEMVLDQDSPDFRERWCRIYMVADQGDVERVPLATLLFEGSDAVAARGTFEVTASGASVLQPVADVHLPDGAYISAGSDGASFAAGLIAKHTPAPVTVEGTFTLADDFVFDVGASALEAAWKVLDSGGFCMQVDGLGGVRVMRKPTEPALELSQANARLLLPGIERSQDLSGIPNRYYATNDRERAVATNVEPSSAVSYPSRGRWVDYTDRSPMRVNGESLAMYAARKLAEMSIVKRSFEYTREYWPGVHPYSVVRASRPDLSMVGSLRVESQRLDCGRGVTIRETVSMEVRA